MAKYSYVVKDHTGKSFKGSLQADSRDKAVGILQEHGYIILEVKEAGGKGALFGGTKPQKGKGTNSKVKSHILAFFAEQLSTLISGGVPLVRAITLLGEHASDPNLGYVLQQIAKDIASGSSFYTALEKHPKTFDHIWLSLVQAGEVGGQLAGTLMQIAVYIKTQDAVRSKIITAVSYPAILFIMSVGVLIYFIVFIVPTFATIFAESNMELPAITQAVLLISHLITHRLPWIIGTLVVAIVAFNVYIRGDAGKKNWHSFLLNIPLLGAFLKNMYYERMLSTLSTLLKSGVTILNSITVLENAFAGNIIIRNALREAKKDVSEGKSISDSFKDTGVFPGMMTEMMRMGEESGRLPNIIDTLAKFYNDHVNQFIARFSAVIDPILIIGVGVIIGIVVMSIFMPIFKMSQMGSNM
ncbi:Type II secretion system subunit [Elusimicrobium minutum Pei191]|uniref:Type II secretion system subunit n=1 Tax=Elusimicrobium minutum (strain Pei191) TaxID=445932 RepID=B2KC08_ELUMP|nr:type II secretion system F family protein [Elusimicrobium minutum]ACC98135.1 Type II secretion system subunit [Elusimicrobium minutum Pei191]